MVIALAFLTAPTPVARMRIFAATAVTLAALAALLALALSFDTIAAMFNERFHLINSYDVGEGGRFRLQELALAAMLQFPNGMGPFEFSRVYGLQQHNVYLQAFLVYGWIGGMSLPAHSGHHHHGRLARRAGARRRGSLTSSSPSAPSSARCWKVS